ncbi:MAG TPA: TonB-dependent receptor, partial [Bradyrhizobium sp.]|nr:TonB-dependent receptor [Bradyrhizobium sp.]
GNIAYVDAHYADYNFTDSNGNPGTFSGNTPPNVPRVVANAGTSYRFATPIGSTNWPVELGITGRHVGDRTNTDANTVTLKAYTVADVYAFVDLPKAIFNAAEQTRVTFRIRNIADKSYAIWGDPFYPTQVLLGAPRTYEMSVAFRW